MLLLAVLLNALCQPYVNTTTKPALSLNFYVNPQLGTIHASLGWHEGNNASPDEPMEIQMTKFLAKIAAAAAFAAAVAAPAMAQNATGTIQLRGNVALSCSIAVQDLGQALSLTAGESNKTVGSVTETCNSGSGYRISLASSNAGKLKSGNFTIDYTVSYDNAAAAALTSQLVVDRATAQFGKKSDVKVNVPASSQYIAGDYADTVTITIAAK